MSNQNALLTFQEMLSNLRARSDWQSLPDIRLAMWPGQVSFSDDLSDRSLFNERYIESRIFVGKLAFVLYLVSGAFIFTTSAFVWLMFDWISGGGSVAEGLVLQGHGRLWTVQPRFRICAKQNYTCLRPVQSPSSGRSHLQRKVQGNYGLVARRPRVYRIQRVRGR